MIDYNFFDMTEFDCFNNSLALQLLFRFEQPNHQFLFQENP